LAFFQTFLRVFKELQNAILKIFSSTGDKVLLLDDAPGKFFQRGKELPVLEITAAKRPAEIQHMQLSIPFKSATKEGCKNRPGILNFIENHRITLVDRLSSLNTKEGIAAFLQNLRCVIPFAMLQRFGPGAVISIPPLVPSEFDYPENQWWNQPTKKSFYGHRALRIY